MIAPLPPDRVDHLIDAAARRGDRRRSLRRDLSAVAAGALVVTTALLATSLVRHSASMVPPAEPTPSASSNEPSPPVSLESSYTEAEQQIIARAASEMVAGYDPAELSITVSRTSDGNDDAFLLRASGPLGWFPPKGPPSLDDKPIGEGVIGRIWLVARDGRRLSSAEVRESDPAGMPSLDPELERDTVSVPSSVIAEPDGLAPPLSPDDAERVRAMVATLRTLLPPDVTLPETDRADPRGFLFTLHSAEGTLRGSFNLWHLTPEAQNCAVTCSGTFRFNAGTVYAEAFDGGVLRTFTYRRSDDAAIYVQLTASGTRALSDEQVAQLLADPAWAPFLDWIKAQPTE